MTRLRNDSQYLNSVLVIDDGDTVLHYFHNDDEPDKYFTGMKVVHKVKTISENLNGCALNVYVRIEYYATEPV